MNNDENINKTDITEETNQQNNKNNSNIKQRNNSNQTPGIKKPGSTRKNFFNTVYGNNYYKDQREELKKQREQLKQKSRNNFKMKKGHEDETIKSDGSNTKEKNIIDKAKDKGNLAKNSVALANNKINSAKSVANKVSHPIESTKEEVKNKAKKKVISVIAKNPYILLIALIFVLVLFILLILIGVLSANAEQETNDYDEQTYVDDTYDFSQTSVNINNNNEIVETVSLKDYMMGATYLEYYNVSNSLTSDQIEELYKTYMVTNKGILLTNGGYDKDDKEITVTSSAYDLKYCDYINGCVSKNDSSGKVVYISNKYKDKINSTELQTYNEASSNIQDILEEAYDETQTEILTPSTYNSEFIGIEKSELPNYNSNISSKWISLAKNNNDYKSIIKNTSEYQSYKIYDLKKYTTSYKLASNSAFWWPIGSKEADSNGRYSGNPMSTQIAEKYGIKSNNGQKTFIEGIIIIPSISTMAEETIVIASKSGTVVEVVNNCSDEDISCNLNNGNYIKIKHDDGYSTIYRHLKNNSITVDVGSNVMQGDKIATMGKSGNGSLTGGDLYFSIMQDNTYINPLEKVSTDNPRASVNTTLNFVDGNNNRQTICLTLKNSGFSNNAVAGMLANIEKESGFRSGAEGDYGTSFGICQWHNGRYNRLKSYCGNEYTAISCQIDYLIYELKNYYPPVLQSLQSNSTAYDMGYNFCYKFEAPAAKNTTCQTRGMNAENYLGYVNNNCN